MFHDLNVAAKGWLRSFAHNRKIPGKEELPIDFVVTWVDGSDPAWQQERNEYLGDAKKVMNGNSACRYRAWDSFKYWFRAVEKYAPWARYVHLVTWGHLPSWLNSECPKLRIVNHKDSMPGEFLPTFNCNSLEVNLFRIKDLSEQFVYFNDDVYLTRKVDKEEFFFNGQPVHTAIGFPWINRDNELPYHLFFNVYGVVNRMNDIRKSIEAAPEKWFSHKYGRDLKYNFDAMRAEGLPGMLFTHMGVPFCKSSMEKTWEKYKNILLKQANAL